MENKAVFTHKCGVLLNEIKPNLLSCEYGIGKDIQLTDVEARLGEKLIADGEYVMINFGHGRYFIDVTANSPCAIAHAIFEKMMFK